MPRAQWSDAYKERRAEITRTKRREKSMAIEAAVMAERAAVAALTACPNPHKKAFGAADDAAVSAAKTSRLLGKTFRIYQCKCSKWHLTSKRKA